MTDSVVAIAVRRPTRANETGRCAVLYPAIAEAARRVGANAVGLIDVGCSAGLNLNVDRVGITYSNGQSLGDPSSPVQLSSSIVGDRPIPVRAMPESVADHRKRSEAETAGSSGPRSSGPLASGAVDSGGAAMPQPY